MKAKLPIYERIHYCLYDVEIVNVHATQHDVCTTAWREILLFVTTRGLAPSNVMIVVPDNNVVQWILYNRAFHREYPGARIH